MPQRPDFRGAPFPDLRAEPCHPPHLSATGHVDGVGASPGGLLGATLGAAAVAFLTPVATPANMMVMGPAGYRFGDYWKLGLPLVVLFGLVSVLLVPVIWPF